MEYGSGPGRNANQVLARPGSCAGAGRKREAGVRPARIVCRSRAEGRSRRPPGPDFKNRPFAVERTVPSPSREPSLQRRRDGSSTVEEPSPNAKPGLPSAARVVLTLCCGSEGGDRFHRTDACAGSAIYAHISVDLIVLLALGDSAGRAITFAGPAAYAIIRNNICHSVSLLFER